MMKVIDIEGLTLHCVKGDPSRIAYILYPMEMLGEWVPWAAEQYGTSIVCLTGMDWDDDLSPWPAPGEPPGSPDFRGLAADFLRTLTHKVVPAAEKALGIAGLSAISPQLSTISRTLVGVSMSGLFAMWQRFQSPLFPTIACLSGSFWYPGFADWVGRQAAPSPLGRVYMLLGKKEPESPVRAFRSVGDDTQRILSHLQSLAVPCHFDWVPGNHYAHPLPRLDRAFAWLAGGEELQELKEL